MSKWNDPWLKIEEGRYRATFNGRTFTLVRGKKTRTRTFTHSWVSIGRKPRRSTTTTWYNVYERVGGEVIDHTYTNRSSPPGSLQEAKWAVLKIATEVKS